MSPATGCAVGRFCVLPFGGQPDLDEARSVSQLPYG